MHNGLQGLIDLTDAAERAHTTHRIIELALSQLPRDQRRYLLYTLAQHLDIDLVELFERGQVMTLLNLDEIGRSASPGVMTTPRAPGHSRDVHAFPPGEPWVSDGRERGMRERAPISNSCSCWAR